MMDAGFTQFSCKGLRIPELSVLPTREQSISDIAESDIRVKEIKYLKY